MSSEVEIRAPAEQTEGTRSQILRWLKSVGDTVAENEPLIELETDKVTVEVASPGSGTLREILKQEQEEIEPGELLGRIEVAGAAKATGGALANEHGAGEGRGDRTAATKSGAVAANGAVATNSERSIEAPVGVSVAPGPAAQSVSPAVRRLLAERGLDASQVRGTGMGGRVTVEDVLAHGSNKAAPGAAASSTGAAPSRATAASTAPTVPAGTSAAPASPATPS